MFWGDIRAYVQAYQNLGVVCAALQKYDESLEAYANALRLTQDDTKHDQVSRLLVLLLLLFRNFVFDCCFQLIYNIGGLLRDMHHPEAIAVVAKVRMCTPSTSLSA